MRSPAREGRQDPMEVGEPPPVHRARRATAARGAQDADDQAFSYRPRGDDKGACSRTKLWPTAWLAHWPAWPSGPPQADALGYVPSHPPRTQPHPGVPAGQEPGVFLCGVSEALVIPEW